MKSILPMKNKIFRSNISRSHKVVSIVEVVCIFENKTLHTLLTSKLGNAIIMIPSTLGE